MVLSLPLTLRFSSLIGLVLTLSSLCSRKSRGLISFSKIFSDIKIFLLPFSNLSPEKFLSVTGPVTEGGGVKKKNSGKGTE